MTKTKTRTEHDSMGTMTVPADVLYGASTQRAVLNFPISGRVVGHEVIHAFALLKRAAAETNHELGRLTQNAVASSSRPATRSPRRSKVTPKRDKP